MPGNNASGQRKNQTEILGQWGQIPREVASVKRQKNGLKTARIRDGDFGIIPAKSNGRLTWSRPFCQSFAEMR